jgi:phage shock protein A
MKDKLTTRISRIITGTANSIVDAIEGSAPETVMEQAIRDVDGVISEVRDELGRVEANKHLLVKSMADLNAKHNAYAEQIETAIAENREDLAETAISKQLDIEAQLPLLEQNLQNAKEEEAELDQAVVALQAKKREMEEDLRRYRSSRQASAGVGARDNTGREKPLHKAERAEGAFSRVHERVTGVGRMQGAIDTKDAGKLAELQELHRRNKIKERLEQAKIMKKDDASS